LFWAWVSSAGSVLILPTSLAPSPRDLGRKLLEAKTAVFTKLRKDVWALGGNANIGIDLDYTMFGNSLVGVIASGTAVIIERQD